VADVSGYGVIPCNTTGSVNREASHVRLLRRKQVNGLILATAALNVHLQRTFLRWSLRSFSERDSSVESFSELPCFGREESYWREV